MPFSFGVHPAFNVPFGGDEKFEDYCLEFPIDTHEKVLLSSNGLYLGKTEKFLLENKNI